MIAFSSISLILLHLFISANCGASPNIIIVGAGSAGIAAASRLVEHGFNNIKILEAEGRIGGRVYSKKFGDAIVDLGAEWYHGQFTYDLVKDLHVLEHTDFSKIYYNSSGEHFDQQFAGELNKIFYKIYYTLANAPEGVSLGDYFIDKYVDKLYERYANDKSKIVFAMQFLNTLRKEALFSKGGFSWFDLSAKSDFVESSTVRGLNWKGRGFITFLDVIMKTYPNPEKQLHVQDKVIFNKEVTRIVWNGLKENGVSIECLDNSVYKADHIILTTSLGVLKDRYYSLFHPPLPQEKIDAIKELGIAAVVKVFFHFPRRWWRGDKFKSISFLWSEKDISELFNTFYNYPQMTDRSWLLDLIGLHPVPRNPNVLEAWFAGESIPQIESFSDEQIVDGIMYTLSKFFRNEYKNIPKPDAVLRFNWYSNPHFRGTYSYQTVQSRKGGVSAEEVLSKPLTSSNGKQVLLFAGEATNPIHYATVHGAVESGFREAERIIQLYK